MPAPAQADYGPPSQAERVARRIQDLEIALDSNGAIILRHDLG